MPHTVTFRHVAFEDLGLLEPLLTRRGHTIRYFDVPVTPLADFDPLTPDLLVVLGGPIGVYQEDLYPFLVPETASIARRLEAGRPTLGICLGSQLIAKALGARVYPSGIKEIGWAPIELSQDGRGSCLRHLGATPVLHWHGDTFDLPDGALHLASTAACRNQAFTAGPHVLALQFHVEVTGTTLESWFVGHTGEIAATAGLSVPQLRADTARYTPALVERGSRALGEWLDSVGL